MELLRAKAAGYWEILSGLDYLGRFFVLALTRDGKLVIIYGLTGRSDGSQNRLVELVPGRDDWWKTNVFDPKRSVGDPEKTIYTALARDGNRFDVTNGRQTAGVLERGLSAMAEWEYEDDDLSTPRIAGLVNYVPGQELEVHMALLKKELSGKKCDRLDFHYNVLPGYGRFISTYKGDSDPPESFEGEPRIVPIIGEDPTQIADVWWKTLNPKNRVAMVVEVVSADLNPQFCVRNRNLGD